VQVVLQFAMANGPVTYLNEEVARRALFPRVANGKCAAYLRIRSWALANHALDSCYGRAKGAQRMD
jgi:hypothetical protein